MRVTSALVGFTLAFCAAAFAAASAWQLRSDAPGASAVAAQGELTTVIIVRHAERATGTGDDPLSDKGRERAVMLSRALGYASVDTILTSEMRRTRETAEPVAQRAGAAAGQGQFKGGAPAKAVAETIRAHAKPGGVVLVVAHSNQVTSVLKELGGWELAPLRESNFDFLFVVTLRQNGKSSLIRAGYPPSAD